MNIDTRHITSINATIPNNDVVNFSSNYLYQNMTRLLTGLFMSSYQLPQSTAESLAPHFAKGLNVLYASEGKMTPEEASFANGLSASLKDILVSMYTDLPPEDLEFTIDMSK